MRLQAVLDSCDAGDWINTSAGGAMSTRNKVKTFLVGSFLNIYGTAVQRMNADESNSVQSITPQTSSGPNVLRQSADSAIMELRRLTGLTWEQLAGLFGASRRSLHFWASGKPMNKKNEEHLYRLLAAIQISDRGSASENRKLLVSAHDGIIPLDLLVEGKYEDFTMLVGQGSGHRQISLTPLSVEAQAARKPLSPEMLVDAQQDRIHRDIGRGRAAQTVRNKQHGRG